MKNYIMFMIKPYLINGNTGYQADVSFTNGYSQSQDTYVRFDRGIDYQANKVKENFMRVLDILGEPYDRDTIISITMRLKSKADWITANNASNALEFKVSRKFWGRKSRYMKLPYVAAIESSKIWDKEHIHALIRMKDLKENY